MGKWRYVLKNGKALRSAIDDGDYDAIVDRLEDCFKEINRALPDDYDEAELERDLEDIEILRENIEDDPDSAEDEIDYELSGFYDLCDGLRVWVEL